jgi:uncharacterized Zn finger protein
MKKFTLQCEKCGYDECEVFVSEDETICAICSECGNFEEDV